MLPALLALQLTATAGVSPAAAREAQDLAQRSAREYDLGHAEEALRDIERAYMLDPAPGLLFNLGQCHRKLRHWEQAETAYRNYLLHRPNAANRDLVKQLIDEVHREQLATLTPAPARAAPAPVAPPPMVIVSQQPRYAPAPAYAPAPPAATAVQAEPAPEKSKSTAWPWVFGASAVVGVACAVVGFIQVGSYYSLKGGSTAANPTPLAMAQSAESNDAWGEPLGIVGAVVTAVGVGGMIWTW